MFPFFLSVRLIFVLIVSFQSCEEALVIVETSMLHHILIVYYRNSVIVFLYKRHLGLGKLLRKE